MAKKPSRKTLTTKLDAEWGRQVRARGSCERCGRIDNLQAAHVYSRRIRSLRWDLRNSMSLCPACHWLWHDRPVDAVEWFKEARPGDYEYLRLESQKTTKYSDADLQDILEELKTSEI